MSNRHMRLGLAPIVLGALASVHCGDASTNPSESTAQAASGVVFSGPIHPHASSGLCLDVVGQGTANGTAVQVWSCSGNPNQQWTYNGTTLSVYGDKCLDMTAGNTANGTRLQIWNCEAGNTNQMWTQTGATFVWSGKGKCLDLTNGVAANGTPIQSWGCYAGDTNQEWSVPTTTSPPPPPPPAQAVDYAPYFPTWVWGGSGYAFTGLADLHNKSGLTK